jgi:DNA invertase Pin-like site-specific DNA recombinase
MASAAGYLREGSFASIEEQKAAINEYHEIALVPFHVPFLRNFCDRGEARSTDFLERPAVEECVTELGEGDHLIVPRMSIAFRSHTDLAAAWDDFEQRGIQIHLANLGIHSNMDDAREAMRYLADLAEADAERSHEIASEKYRSGRAAGKSIGKPPVGMRYVGQWGRRRLIVDEQDQAAMRLIAELHAAGDSLDRIYWHLFRNDILRASGREWGRSTIHAVIQQAKVWGPIPRAETGAESDHPSGAGNESRSA